MHLKRSGKFCAFLDLNIGSPFYAHGKFWTRIDSDVGCVLSEGRGSVCNFVIDGTEKSKADPWRSSERIEIVDCEL
jgi:hypothetical protein